MDVAALARSQHDAAIELWHEVGLTRPWNDPVADLDRAVDGPASDVLAGTEDDALVATVMVGHDGHRGWVYYLAVSPQHRGHGHGRAIMRAAEAWLIERHIPKLNLMVRGGNAQARGFYAALGYTIDDVIVLARRLSG